MLEKKISNGKIYAALADLNYWDKNPRLPGTPEDDERMIRQIAFLGQYKPNFVTEDGIHVGGNKRLKAMSWLNVNVYVWTDKDGKSHEINRMGQFNDIWITELGFGKVEHSQEYFDAGGVQKYKALLDGEVQEREYNSIEQIMLEYAISDNDPIGQYDQEALHELTKPHREFIPQGTYKLELAPSISLEKFDQDFEKEQARKKAEEGQNENKKDKKIVVRVEYTPEQFKEIEPRIDTLRELLGVESNTDLFTKMVEIAESQAAAESEDITPAADTEETSL